MTPQETIAAALARCPTLPTRSLEEFLDSFLDEDLDTLAQMPGTPGQVMSAQFTHYVRSSVALTETQRRDSAHASKIMDAILRLPIGRKRIARREAPDGASSSRPQTSAA